MLQMLLPMSLSMTLPHRESDVKTVDLDGELYWDELCGKIGESSFQSILLVWVEEIGPTTTGRRHSPLNRRR